MADQKITQLTAGTPTTDDLIAFVDDPGGGSPQTKKSTVANLLTLVAPSGMVLLEEHIASASATVSFTTRNKNGYTGASFQTDFDDYIFKFINVRPATDTQDFHCVISSNGGTSYVSTNYYYGWTYVGNNAVVGSVNSGGSSAAQWVIFTVIDKDFSSGVSGQMEFFDPLTSSETNCTFDVFARQSTNIFRGSGAGYQAAATAVNAVRFKFASGNVASGTIRLYGVSK